jgi:hypothetical protein
MLVVLHAPPLAALHELITDPFTPIKSTFIVWPTPL